MRFTDLTRIVLLTTILLLTLGIVTGTGSELSIPLEYQVKAEFLYRFINFVEWPEGALPDTPDTIVIGVLGKSEIHEALEAVVESREPQKQAVTLRYFEHPAEVTVCHILFIGRVEKMRLKDILRGLRGWNTLTVGEDPEFARQGGIVRFIIIENRVGFEINIAAAEDADLGISSKLLRSSRIVGER